MWTQARRRRSVQDQGSVSAGRGSWAHPPTKAARPSAQGKPFLPGVFPRSVPSVSTQTDDALLSLGSYCVQGNPEPGKHPCPGSGWQHLDPQGQSVSFLCPRGGRAFLTPHPSLFCAQTSGTGKKITQPRSALPGGCFYGTTPWASCTGQSGSQELRPVGGT